MANNPNPDRDTEYMRKLWGTESLITDYDNVLDRKKKIIQEIMHDEESDFIQDWLNIRRFNTLIHAFRANI